MTPWIFRPTKAFRGFAALFLLPGAALPLLGQYQDFWEDFDTTRSASLSLAYDSSVFGNSSNVSDTILQGSLRGSLTRDFKFATLGVEANAVFAQFLDFDALNYEDISLNWIIDLSEQIGNRRTQISASVSANETSSANSDIAGRATVRNYDGRVQLSYVLTSRISTNASINYSKKEPQSAVSTQIDSMGNLTQNQSIFGSEAITTSLGLNWDTRGSFSYTLDGSYSETESERATDNTQEVYSLQAGVSGQLLPKITGSLSAGYSNRETDMTSTSTPVVRGRLSWAISNLNNLSLTVSRSFSVSLNGSDTEVTTFGLGYNHQLTRKLGFNASALFSQTDYTNTPGSTASATTTNEIITLSSSLSYPLLRWLSASGDVRWQSQESDLQANAGFNSSSDSVRVSLTLSANF